MPAPRDPVTFGFGGRRSLDLTWTLRYRAVRPTELLAEPVDLARWLEAVGLPAPDTPTHRDLLAARALREAVHRAATALIDGGPIDPDDRALLNRRAAEPAPVPVLAEDGTCAFVTPRGGAVAASLSALARDAIDLFATAGDGRLRRCCGPRCSLLFHDDSRPGTRRWCDTARCGNRTNTKAYRERRRSAG